MCAKGKERRFAHPDVVLSAHKRDHTLIQLTGSRLALSAVKIAAEMATPKDAPSDEAIL